MFFASTVSKGKGFSKETSPFSVMEELDKFDAAKPLGQLWTFFESATNLIVVVVVVVVALSCFACCI